MTLILLVPLISLGYSIRSPVGYAKEDLAISYADGRQTLGVFDSILGIFEGKPLEYQIEIDANQIFANETLKREIINKSGSFEFTIPSLNYSLLGFNISASDVKVNANAKQVMDDSGGQSNKTRIDFPVMLARSVNVSNDMISQKYENVDLSSIYAFYDPETDKFTFHIPYEIAARYLISGS